MRRKCHYGDYYWNYWTVTFSLIWITPLIWRWGTGRLIYGYPSSVSCRLKKGGWVPDELLANSQYKGISEINLLGNHMRKWCYMVYWNHYWGICIYSSLAFCKSKSSNVTQCENILHNHSRMFASQYRFWSYKSLGKFSIFSSPDTANLVY